MKLANDIPKEVVEVLLNIDFSKITERDYQELIKIFNDFEKFIPKRKDIILGKTNLNAKDEFVMMINVIDFSKIDKMILKISVNYLKKNLKQFLKSK